MQLEDRKVAILGGSAGIGLATAALLAEQGAQVTIGGRDERRLADAASSLPGSARTIVADATDPGSLRNFFSQAGPLGDLVVTVTSRNNSGGGPARTLAGQDLAAAFAGKLTPYLRAVALSLDTLAERGSITLTSGATAQSALPGTAGPAAINGAIEAAVPIRQPPETHR